MRRPTAEDGVLVVGITGAGKTTVAAEIAVRLGLRFAQLDALQIGPGWSERPRFLDDVEALTDRPGWVTDSYGGDPRARTILWRRATYVVWLDLPLVLTASRAARRSLARSWRREPVFGANVETWSGWLTLEHPLWSSIRCFRARRRAIEQLIVAHGMAAVRLRRPAQVRALLASL